MCWAGRGLAIDLWGRRLSASCEPWIARACFAAGSGPVLVSGRTLGQCRSWYSGRCADNFAMCPRTFLSRLRTVRVYVVGGVNEPGASTSSSLSAPLNALLPQAELPGADRCGRETYRSKTLVEEVDAYDLLLQCEL